MQAWLSHCMDWKRSNMFLPREQDGKATWGWDTLGVLDPYPHPKSAFILDPGMWFS